MNAINTTPAPASNRLEYIIDQQGRELDKPFRALITESAHTVVSACVLVRTAIDTGSVIMAGNYVETCISTRADIAEAQHKADLVIMNRQIEMAELKRRLHNLTTAMDIEDALNNGGTTNA